MVAYSEQNTWFWTTCWIFHTYLCWPLGCFDKKKSSKLFWICKWGQIGGKSSSVTCPSFVHLTSFILLLVMQRTKFYFFIGNLKVKQAISCYCSSLDLFDVKLGPFFKWSVHYKLSQLSKYAHAQYSFFLGLLCSDFHGKEILSS